MKKKFFLLVTFISLFVTLSLASNPVSWKFSLVDKGNGEIDLVATATIAANWHLYDTNLPEGGPNPTTLTIDELQGATKLGKFKANRTSTKVYDEIFDMQVAYFDNSVSFTQRFKVTDKAKFKMEGDIRAQACNDETCTPPDPISFSFTSAQLPQTLVVGADNNKEEQPVTADTVAVAIEKTSVDTVATASPAVPENIGASGSETDLWTPVTDQLKPFRAEDGISNRSLIMIFILGFGGGLLALFMPCIWPMIPMTVSFFLKRNKKSRAGAIKDAVTYGLSIVVIYVLLGLIITAIFGASALNDLSTSAIFNLLFFALLVVFAASFFGAFEIVLPSSWTNKMDSKADSTTGLLSIFFMAFTLALVSFSCTGPIIGTLLVESAVSGAIIAPAMGMLGFSLALSIPFALFAIFPSWLESMPKSGGWLNSVKVVLGFLELALALKFLSVADLAYGWRILDREVFLVLWIIIFILLGVYLLGKLKFAHDSDLKHVSVTRLFLAIISLSFAVYLIPGLWGAPLKAISAFAPPLKTQDFNLYDGDVHAKFEDYDEGMAYARRNNKPVIIDFSGYGCVNCRKMENSVWIDSRVKNILENDYVLITLMVDDKKSLPEVLEVKEANGEVRKLKTVGDKWSYLQRHKFGTNSQPYYVLLGSDGNPIGPWYAYNENVDDYIKFLNIGLNNFREKSKE
ncbi:cytochrome c biogenesis protein CcdA [Dysgonomonas sp. 520]|uniref:protein-disulfide reductase DsbD family protein n=1 Tax=Dysgonomonas sp. 520 TaxID=2302931 RepID=UPI0013D39BD4|nr:cytochrome c biogenesis protein CcdA [Dysgonomonas sp. 520]NDW10013.1 thiol:disulfide interchange protein [Dysgonomonas sp. 520]